MTINSSSENNRNRNVWCVILSFVCEMKGDRMTSVSSGNGKSISRTLVVVMMREVFQVFQVCLRKCDDNNLDEVTTNVEEYSSNKKKATLWLRVCILYRFVCLFMSFGNGCFSVNVMRIWECWLSMCIFMERGGVEYKWVAQLVRQSQMCLHT